MNHLTAPVVLIVFNQPDSTKRVFNAVAAARPRQLFIIADAPRAGRPDEAERCKEAMRVTSAVNWDCKVETNLASTNMGPGPRIISGLDWVFSQVEEAIILEHDCLPHSSFFPFCTELLERYRNKSQIGFITGFNPVRKSFPYPFSYYFSPAGNLWGWATWARLWREYDGTLGSWPEVKETGMLRNVFPKRRMRDFWSQTFDAMHRGVGPSTWDYQLLYTCWVQNCLGIIPSKNLVEYLGFGPQAENTKTADPWLTSHAREVHFPLVHPPAINAWPSHAVELQDRFFGRSLKYRVQRRIRQFCKKK